MKERLQKILARAGFGSRRACESLILEGRVSVNGETAMQLGARADAAVDRITLDGERVRPGERMYLALNKPPGFLCTRSDSLGRPTVYDLIGRGYGRLYTVGRLDRDAAGLLLLTNDGDFAQRVAHPGGTIGKEYRVIVERELTPGAMKALERGIVLDGVRTLPSRVLGAERMKRGERVTIRIREGRNRQVKRMFLAVGAPVRRLERTAIGGLRLGALAPGAFRRLGREDLERVFRAGGAAGKEGRSRRSRLWYHKAPRRYGGGRKR